eukprot:TRINITY_DN2522_c0_g1_i13.p1 TRINITY_DN2522_c0_g1~~TRINITY_DN2522_c0_g1_i13.p1  ORF type:complete len:389 (+),score=51.15 TRINITY_DN2522_c0_g1_i13:428-1594(+)
MHFDLDSEIFRFVRPVKKPKYKSDSSQFSESEFMNSTKDCYVKIKILFERDVEQSVWGEEFGDWKVSKLVHKLHGKMEFPFCNNSDVSLEGETYLAEKYYRKFSNYNLFVVFFTVLEILAILHLFENTSTSASHLKLSHYFIAFQSLMDANITMAHLATGNLWKVYTATAFLNFVLFSFFELRMAYQIWRLQRPNGNLISYCVLFYLWISVELFLLSITLFMNITKTLLLLSYSYPLLQIFHNSYYGCENSVPIKYILVTCFSRLAIPLYFLVCPTNVLSLEPNEKFAFFLVLWTVVQVLILLAQDKFGPQFFVPSWMKPWRYNYWKPVSLAENEECVICKCEIEVVGSKLMTTPCHHVFHEQCLTQWFESKLECPLCRASLPPPFHD